MHSAPWTIFCNENFLVLSGVSGDCRMLPAERCWEVHWLIVSHLFIAGFPDIHVQQCFLDNFDSSITLFSAALAQHCQVCFCWSNIEALTQHCFYPALLLPGLILVIYMTDWSFQFQKLVSWGCIRSSHAFNTASIDLSQPWPCTSTQCTASSTTIRVARGIESGSFWATFTLALQGNSDPVASWGVHGLAGCVLRARASGLQKMWQVWASSESSCQTLLAALQSMCEGTTWCLIGSLAPQFPGFVFGKIVYLMSLCENLREHGSWFWFDIFVLPRPFRATIVLPGTWAHGKSLDLWSAAHGAPSSTASWKWAGWQFILMKRMMTSWPCNGKWCDGSHCELWYGGCGLPLAGIDDCLELIWWADI